MSKLIIASFIALFLIMPLVHAGGWGATNETGDTRCADSIDNDGDSFMDIADDSCRAHISGYVLDETGATIENAEVHALGTTYEKATTDATGHYEFYVIPKSLGGSYSYLFATNETHKSVTINETTYGNFTYLTSYNINFTLTEKNSQCESDCTYTSDNICHIECLGLGGCTNAPLAGQPGGYDTLSTCGATANPYAKGIAYTINATHRVKCCRGDPYRFVSPPIKDEEITNINPNINNIIKTERIVTVDGQTYKVNLVVFNK